MVQVERSQVALGTRIDSAPARTVRKGIFPRQEGADRIEVVTHERLAADRARAQHLHRGVKEGELLLQAERRNAELGRRSSEVEVRLEPEGGGDYGLAGGEADAGLGLHLILRTSRWQSGTPVPLPPN